LVAVVCFARLLFVLLGCLFVGFSFFFHNPKNDKTRKEVSEI
jgi:hypothetical protein